MNAPKEHINYDKQHDILYIHFNYPKIGYEDEISPGIFLRKDEETDEILGVIIMGYKKKDTANLKRIVPLSIDYNKINTSIN